MLPLGPETHTGSFDSVVASTGQVCALNDARAYECWSLLREHSVSDGPYDSIAVSASRKTTCGVRTDATIDCWGDTSAGLIHLPPELPCARCPARDGG